MNFDDLFTGSVIRYPYLWRYEALRGALDGRKNKRPTVVGFRVKRTSGYDIVWLFPITSKQPLTPRLAVEIPDIEKRRAGLDTRMRLWIILDEFNEDVIGKSYNLPPEPPIGKFSRAFILPVLKMFLANRATTQGVNRA